MCSSSNWLLDTCLRSLSLGSSSCWLPSSYSSLHKLCGDFDCTDSVILLIIHFQTSWNLFKGSYQFSVENWLNCTDKILTYCVLIIRFKKECTLSSNFLVNISESMLEVKNWILTCTIHNFCLDRFGFGVCTIVKLDERVHFTKSMKVFVKFCTINRQYSITATSCWWLTLSVVLYEVVSTLSRLIVMLSISSATCVKLIVDISTCSLSIIDV